MEDNAMSSTVRYVINGAELVIGVKPEQEKLFRWAGEIVNNRILELTKEHSYRYNAVQVATLAAIEAMVQALVTHEEYNKFQEEINSYLDGLSGNVA